jgi:hypothetical protein
MERLGCSSLSDDVMAVVKLADQVAMYLETQAMGMSSELYMPGGEKNEIIRRCALSLEEVQTAGVLLSNADKRVSDLIMESAARFIVLHRQLVSAVDVPMDRLALA